MSVLVALLETGRPSRPVTGHTIGMCVLALRLVACLSMQGLPAHDAPGQYLCTFSGIQAAMRACRPLAGWVALVKLCISASRNQGPYPK